MRIQELIKKYLPQTLGGPSDTIYKDIIYWIPFCRLVSQCKPHKILEIGVFQGESAKGMIKAARCKNIEYYGFDLFEERLPEYEKGYSENISPKSLDEMKKELDGLGAKIFLFRGDTRKTLPREIPRLPMMDFIYIDGGHSYEMCKSDWEDVRKLMHEKTVVVFDDYGLEGVRRTVNEINEYEYEIKKRSFGAVVRKRKSK